MAVGVQRAISIKTLALIGNPNTGKTTLFNALTGLSQQVGNYPGVTVEHKVGKLNLEGGPAVQLLDLPGAYSLSAHSPDEMIAVDVLLGQQQGAKSGRRHSRNRRFLQPQPKPLPGLPTRRDGPASDYRPQHD